jgi:hypothetical protein
LGFAIVAQGATCRLYAAGDGSIGNNPALPDVLDDLPEVNLGLSKNSSG